MSESSHDTCFFLMPFRKPFTDYYEVLKPALEKLGLKVHKADEMPGVGIILKDIWESILSAKIIIADLSESNINVLYELGLSHSVNKPVIIISQKIEEIPSDIRHHRVILYNTDDQNWIKHLRKEVITTTKKILREGIFEVIPPAFSKQFEISHPFYELIENFDLERKRYIITHHRFILNRTDAPITQYGTRFYWSRYLDNPAKDFEFFSKNRILWKEVSLKAWDNEGAFDTKLIHDYNNSKDFTIFFAQRGVERSISPQESRECWYSLNVPFRKMAPYTYFICKFPTTKARMTLIVPRELDIQVGGLELSPFRDPIPLSPKFKRIPEKNAIKYVWESDQLTLGNIYQPYWSELPKKYLK